MKSLPAFLLAFIGTIAPAAVSQTPPPTLTTADKIALTTLERARKDAQDQLSQVQQSELTVMREWQSAHPGWRINPQTFAVEGDKAETKPSPAPKGVK